MARRYRRNPSDIDWILGVGLAGAGIYVVYKVVSGLGNLGTDVSNLASGATTDVEQGVADVPEAIAPISPPGGQDWSNPINALAGEVNTGINYLFPDAPGGTGSP